jgi:hypothetical protein
VVNEAGGFAASGPIALPAPALTMHAAPSRWVPTKLTAAGYRSARSNDSDGVSRGGSCSQGFDERGGPISIYLLIKS